LAPARRLEACLIAALVAAAPIAAVTVYHMYSALRTSPAGPGVPLGLLPFVVVVAVLGALAGLSVVFGAGPTRTPLRIGISAASSIYGGIALGQAFDSSTFHSEWYAYVIAVVGGVIVGPLLLLLVYRLSGDLHDDGEAPPALGQGLRTALRWITIGLVICVGFAEYAVHTK
jgi:hypothetical protein